MRGRGRRNRIIVQTRVPGETTTARERVESAGFSRMERDAGLARLVTARDTRREPFHRWMVFKQAFSPGLVRRFLRDEALLRPAPGSAPLLDPFSGTGTFVIECARQNIPAIGVDALLSTAFVTNVKALAEIPDVPDLSGCIDWPQVADRVAHPAHRAALICAVAARHTAKGTLNRNAPPLLDSFNACVAMMRDDILHPLPRRNIIVHADGCDLACLADASIGGILTSPPYLSRHDYAKLAQPQETVYAHWYGTVTPKQLPASPQAHGLESVGSPFKSVGPPIESVGSPPMPNLPAPIPDAVLEACDALMLARQQKPARLVRTYFQGLLAAISDFRRVLKAGAPCWIVIGGARLKDVYIPTDTILADYARSAGFAVDRILVARNLIPSGRKFGRLTNIAPRESILVMRCI